jgi:AcrR family transcriptional regulator
VLYDVGRRDNGTYICEVPVARRRSVSVFDNKEILVPWRVVGVEIRLSDRSDDTLCDRRLNSICTLHSDGRRSRSRSSSANPHTSQRGNFKTRLVFSPTVATTRANLHYHFGSKDELIEEVLADYAATTTEFYRTTFTAPNISLREKMRRIRDFLKDRYDRFNPDGLTSHPWSLSARLRSDWEALSPKMKSLMRNFTAENEISVRIGVALAVSSGELREGTPQENVSLLLVNNILYAANITRDMQSFDRLVELWEATLDAIEGAYGNAGRKGSSRSKVSQSRKTNGPTERA